MPELEKFHGPRWPYTWHKHTLKYFWENEVPWLEGTFMVWHCWCGARYSIKRLGYERLLRGEIKLQA